MCSSAEVYVGIILDWFDLSHLFLFRAQDCASIRAKKVLVEFFFRFAFLTMFVRT